MKCFSKDYSAIYDFLYTKKNYTKETRLLKKIIKKYLPHSKSLLDLGCGTGQYSNLMTKLQLNIVGVDRSSSMLKIAKKKYKKNKKLNFVKSEIEKIDLNKKFDIISALFHILSYHTTDIKINKFFSKSHSHLNNNGILIFDFWYKEGVFNLQSPLRVREVENNSYKIIRITISKWFKKINQIFDIHNLIVMNKKNKKILKFSETHKMRYFTLNIIKKKLKEHNFKFLESLDLQAGKAISSKSWGALVVAKKI
ncbi:class I SAM-dependent methyltransferase [Pelagibacteraceae bacterium]|nr:class I SAM-dependent methyltransferase [Pelagibacteraceae bacterium]